MGERIRILGVSVDKVKTDKILNLTNVYLKNDCLNIIYFAGMKTAMLAQDNEDFANFVDTSDLVIAGDIEIEEQIFDFKAGSGKKHISGKYLEWLFMNLNKLQSSMFIIDKEESRLEYQINAIGKLFPNITCEGEVISEETESKDLDVIVNNINTIAPDVLLLCIDEWELKEFIENYRTKINARLCLCSSDSMLEVEPDYKLPVSVPKIIDEIHLTGLYQWIFRNKDINLALVRRNFQKRIKDLKNQKENDDEIHL